MISDQEESVSNFEKVIEIIKENILYNHLAVSMKTFTEVCNPIQADDKRYRYKLKDRIEETYIRFLSF